METSKRCIYFDNNSTTPLHPAVLEAMLPYLRENFGNPSSTHALGYDAQKAVRKARRQVADLIGCAPEEIIWTSGATESNNMAVLGMARKSTGHQFHAITSNVEHKAVLEVFKALQEFGYDATVIPADPCGQVHVKSVLGALKATTQLISFMAANNEIGTLNPVLELGEFARERGLIFHCDAAQALGKIPFHVNTLRVDMASFSAHKLYGPKGVGALYVRKGTQLNPLIFGGTQEGGLRPGTLNVAGIVGFGEACEIAGQKLSSESTRLQELRTYILSRLETLTPGLKVNGHLTERLPGHLNITSPEMDPDMASLHLCDFALSRGSACSQGDASYVLMALGMTPELAQRSLRIGLGWQNTREEAELFVSKWAELHSTRSSLQDKSPML